MRTVRLQEKKGLGTQEDQATATKAARKEWMRPPRLDQDSYRLQWTRTQKPVPSLWETAVRAATISGHSFLGPLPPDLPWPSLLGHLAKQQSPVLT